MGYFIPPAHRVALQGESKQTVRWDLMRPAEGKTPPVPPPITKFKDLPAEVILLARCHSHYWRQKTLETLLRDYNAREDRMKKVPVFVRVRAEAIALKHDVPVYLLFGKTKTQQVLFARQELMVELRNLKRKTGQPSMHQVARWTLRYDHTSVISAERAVARRQREA